jgi:phosphotransferase system enzyme I (PtsI)
LLGLGLDEFSMSASSILRARQLIKRLEMSKMRELAEHALTLESEEAIRAYIKEKVYE